MAGNIVHFEINAKDANRAKRFYTSLFGWKYKDSEVPGIEYYVIDGANPGGAINPMQQDPGPVVYFDTDDIDASIAKVRDYGATMDELIQEFVSEVADADGHVYTARAIGRQRTGRTVWEGWFEFAPLGGRGIVRRSQVETTQPNREALVYWASGIERVYLEGALERAIASRADRRARSK